MVIYISELDESTIQVRARAEGPDGLVGDMVQNVHPGEEIFGKSFEELASLGSGKVEIE